ncbi:MAG TPA: FAD:protein FMN transferase [Solirubrobacteraceae bacterium]|nr:FAD:protein FMN transferase [Solirubrobacteraceae bacterium]
MSMELDYTFHAMGSDVRLLIGKPLLHHAASPEQVAERERTFVLDFARRLSRFRPDSELTVFNRDRRPAVPASQLLRAAVTAAVWAAERSDGLVDPTLVGELERSGYAASLDGSEPASLREALATAPARRAARPSPAARWRQIIVDNQSGLIYRPPGVMVDTGGTGKGLCADAVARRLGSHTRFVVDCGGDIAVGGVGAGLEPYEIEVEHPLTQTRIGTLRVGRGGVATSGLNVRIWRDGAGAFAHHLLDPSTGTPAWSGLIGATALGPSALEAETLSKLALLLGPAAAREVLAQYGGVIVHDDGAVESAGPCDWRVEPATTPMVAA